MKRLLGQVWKEDNLWKVQGLGIIVGYKTKKEAEKVASIVTKEIFYK